MPKPIQILKTLVPIPHNTPKIMGGKDKNFQDSRQLDYRNYENKLSLYLE